MSSVAVSTDLWRNDKLGESPALYFPSEGFGALYRRVMLNDMLSTLVGYSTIDTVAEFPMDPHGAPGAGSLIFSALGRTLSLVCDRADALDRARSLYEQRGFANVRYLCGPLDSTALADDEVDLSWSFDRLQATPDPAKTVAEIARVSKTTLIIVPNANNYGQYLHFLYHKWAKSACDYVGPRHWMRTATVGQALQAAGFEVLSTGIIDAPWWPGFPELPALVKKALTGHGPNYSTSPSQSVQPDLIARLIRRAQRSDFIECSALPDPVKLLFSHNLFVLAAKPAYRRLIGYTHPEPAWRARRQASGPFLRLCA